MNTTDLVCDKELHLMIHEDADAYLILSVNKFKELSVKISDHNTEDGIQEGLEFDCIPAEQAIQLRDFLNYCYPSDKD